MPALVFSIAQAQIERVVPVSDAAIVAAQRALWDVCRIVAEPGAAAPLAALIGGATCRGRASVSASWSAAPTRRR